MKKIKIQQQELKDGTLPYPYFIEKGGFVGRQDFWKGKPLKLLGFAKRPTAGSFDLWFTDFWKNPEKAVGMYPVFADKDDQWVTHTIKVESIAIL